MRRGYNRQGKLAALQNQHLRLLCDRGISATYRWFSVKLDTIAGRELFAHWSGRAFRSGLQLIGKRVQSQIA
jgi:hypothetical protein